MATQLSISADQYANLRKSGLTKDQIISKYSQAPAESPGAGILTGVAKGVVSTVKNAATIGSEVANQTVGRVINAAQGKGFKPLSSDQLGQDDITNPNGELSQKMDQQLAPDGAAQNIGYYGEKIGEFFIPGLDEGKAALSVEAAPSFIPDSLKLFATKAASDATKNATVSAVQSNGDLKQTAENTAFSGAFDAASAGVGQFLKTSAGKAAVNYLSEKVPAAMVNRIIHPSIKDFSFGKNPGQGVLDEPGLLGVAQGPVTRAGLLTRITNAKQDVGAQIGQELGKVAATTIDLTDAVTKPVDAAIDAAVRSGEQTLVDRLVGLRTSLTHDFKMVGNKVVPAGEKNLIMSPLEAQNLKIEQGQNTRWTGQAFDNDVNKVRVQIYRNIDNAIDEAAPATKDLNSRYANLLTAEKSLERRNAQVQRLVSFGIRQTGVGTAFGLGSYLTGSSPQDSALKGVAATLAVKASASTAAQTRIAAALHKLAPAERESIFKIAPALRSTYLGIRTTKRSQQARAQSQATTP